MTNGKKIQARHENPMSPNGIKIIMIINKRCVLIKEVNFRKMIFLHLIFLSYNLKERKLPNKFGYIFILFLRAVCFLHCVIMIDMLCTPLVHYSPPYTILTLFLHNFAYWRWLVWLYLLNFFLTFSKSTSSMQCLVVNLVINYLHPFLTCCLYLTLCDNDRHVMYIISALQSTHSLWKTEQVSVDSYTSRAVE